jgi:hypothetical protein
MLPDSRRVLAQQTGMSNCDQTCEPYGTDSELTWQYKDNVSKDLVGGGGRRASHPPWGAQQNSEGYCDTPEEIAVLGI